jgi:uncharacterized Tic20 family protein
MSNTPASEQRLWAIISHLSALALGMGIVLPVIGWSDQRRKSNYASFQCLQALGYQSLGYTIWILSYLVIIIVASILLLVTLGSRTGRGQNMDAAVPPWTIMILIVVIGSLVAYFLLPIIAAVACAFGRDFRYPILGNRLAGYLAYDLAEAGEEQTWLIEDHEDRWVAGMGHFSVIIAIWGMAAPLIAWVLQGQRRLFLKLQSMQALVYQAGVTILYLGTVFFYLFGVMIISLMAMLGRTENMRMDSPVAMAGILFLAVSLLVIVLVMLLVPLLHILGQWAGYRVLKGDDYRYPLVGRLVEKWISQNSTSKEKIP